MTTREERFAASVAELRAEYTHMPDHYWDDMAAKQQLQWQLDDLRSGIAQLVGGYGWQAEQDPGNTHLAALVAELQTLLSAGTRERVTS